jgi:hypothetical protein
MSRLLIINLINLDMNQVFYDLTHLSLINSIYLKTLNLFP